MSIVSLEKVGKEVSNGARRTILSDVDLDVQEGDYVAIRGRSGSGKSTLLSIIGGLQTATSGKVKVCGQALDKASEDQRASFRLDNVGFVFQAFHLLTRLSAWENVAVPLVLSRRRGAVERLAKEALTALGIGELADARPSAMSGGQQQRVAIARALVTSPKLILADEPTGNLDEGSTEDVLAALRRAREVNGATVLLVTHDPLVAATAGYELEIVDGRLQEGAA